MNPLFPGAKTVALRSDVVTDVQPREITTLPARVQVQPRAVSAFRIVTDDEIDKLGTVAGGKAAEMSGKILQAVKASDTEQFGKQLNELVTTAKGLDPAKMGNKGVIGKVLGFFGNAKEQVLGQVQSIEQRISALTLEMEKSVALYTTRIGDIERLYEENYQAYQALGREVEQCRGFVDDLKAQLSGEQAATDAFGAQRQSDIQDRIDRVEKKIDDLQRGQALAELAAPELRQMQNNSRALAQTFNDIKTVTIPAYMGVFSRYVLNLEAKKGAELAASVQDATDAAFRMQADQLVDTSAKIATARARSVVSIETIEYMQKQLFASFDAAQKITEDAKVARIAAQPKLQQIEMELVQRFVPKQLSHN
jgi:uncharacterized protein YaaN involved in tellurite resistance